MYFSDRKLKSCHMQASHAHSAHTHTQCAQCAHTHTRRRPRTFYKCWRGFVFEGLEHLEIENYHRNDWKYFKWILYCMLWYVNFQPLKSVLHSIWTVLHLAITFPSKVWCSVLLFFLQIFKIFAWKMHRQIGPQILSCVHSRLHQFAPLAWQQQCHMWHFDAWRQQQVLGLRCARFSRFNMVQSSFCPNHVEAISDSLLPLRCFFSKRNMSDLCSRASSGNGKETGCAPGAAHNRCTVKCNWLTSCQIRQFKGSKQLSSSSQLNGRREEYIKL